MPLLATIVSFFTLSLFLWWSFDHSYPFWDGAAHVKDSIAYAQLLKHAHIFKIDWIKHFLTVNYDYPLTVHLINGAFKAVLGYGRRSDMAALIFYQFILLFSIYGLAKKLGKSTVAAALAMVFISCYPLVATLSHVPLLDYAYLAFTTFGLWGIAQFDQKQTWRSAIIMGLALCLGATSKQISVIFLIAPCLYLLGREVSKKHWLNVGKLALAGACPAVGLLVWFLPNLKALKAWRDYYKDDPTLGGGFVNVFFDHLNHYLSGLVGMLSPGLLLLAVVSLVFLWRSKDLKRSDVYIPLAASICGLLLMCCVGMNKPEERYVIPLAIAPAIYSGQAIAALLTKQSWKILSWLILAFTLIQFILLNYTPYPVAMPPAAVDAIYTISGHSKSREMVEPRPSPTPPGDKWGQEWLVEQIQKGSTAGGKKITLNILPSTPDLSVHTIDLVCIFANTLIEPSSFRQFTLHGDIVRYDENAINYYDWFLLKTGYQGSPLDSDASRANYQKVVDYIEKPGHFKLFAERKLPDDSMLKLYQRIQ